MPINRRQRRTSMAEIIGKPSTDAKQLAYRQMHRAVPCRKRSTNENPNNPAVKCPGVAGVPCGRITQADMFVDVSDLDIGAVFICDACAERLRRTGVM